MKRQPNKKPTVLPWAMLLVLYCMPLFAAPSEEYAVKAAFVHNFAKFVEWPAAINARRTLRLCVLGRGRFAEAASGLHGKPVGNGVWEVAEANSGTDLKECQVLFVEASEADKLPGLLNDLKASPVLTVGDREGYAEQGVAVNFYLEQRKVRFEINPAAARRAGLKISSQLLKVARIVTEPGGGQ